MKLIKAGSYDSAVSVCCLFGWSTCTAFMKNYIYICIYIYIYIYIYRMCTFSELIQNVLADNISEIKGHLSVFRDTLLRMFSTNMF